MVFSALLSSPTLSSSSSYGLSYGSDQIVQSNQLESLLNITDWCLYAFSLDGAAAETLSIFMLVSVYVRWCVVSVTGMFRSIY